MQFTYVNCWNILSREKNIILLGLNNNLYVADNVWNCWLLPYTVKKRHCWLLYSVMQYCKGTMRSWGRWLVRRCTRGCTTMARGWPASAVPGWSTRPTREDTACYTVAETLNMSGRYTIIFLAKFGKRIHRIRIIFLDRNLPDLK